MSRTKLKDRVLPTYTKGEEIFNMTSHIVRRCNRYYCNNTMCCYGCIT